VRASASARAELATSVRSPGAHVNPLENGMLLFVLVHEAEPRSRGALVRAGLTFPKPDQVQDADQVFAHRATLGQRERSLRRAQGVNQLCQLRENMRWGSRPASCLL